MKSIHWFQIGAAIDLIGIGIALYFVISDFSSRSGGTNNPTMYKAILLFGSWIAIAFLLKSFDKLTLANLVLWLPGTALLGYALMTLLFIIFKPRF